MVGFGKSKALIKKQQKSTYKKPAVIIFHGYASVVCPLPLAELNGYGLHNPVEQRGDQSPIEDYGEKANTAACTQGFSCQHIPYFIEQALHKAACAVNDDEPVDADHQGNTVQLQSQCRLIYVFSKQKLIIDTKIFGKEAGKKTQYEEEQKSDCFFFLCPYQQACRKQKIKGRERCKQRLITIKHTKQSYGMKKYTDAGGNLLSVNMLKAIRGHFNVGRNPA